ncbi:MAG TPA: SDR family NAD(P)-dependent oxidoreductase, partial [Candidatus Methylomirabilis sp.]|nr:SDR family NAD(P)-dependent oxidoreductase [Candidatus Methylomirabilis sp.]
MRFAGKTVLITGAGSGIGAASARLMASQGAAVGVMGRTARTVERTVQQVRDADARALAIVGDVSVESDVDRAIRQTV